MALEDLTGPSKFINALNQINPDGATDTLDQADDHMRGIKNVLKNSFPNITAAMTATAAILNGLDGRVTALESPTLTPAALNPVGTIHISTDSTNPGTFIPGTTWVQIGQGRCLIGEGTGGGLTARAAGAEIGSEDSVVVAHQHDSAGAHTHTVPLAAVASSEGGSGDLEIRTSPPTATSSAGAHQHPSEGVSGVDQNMQPSLVVYMFERTL